MGPEGGSGLLSYLSNEPRGGAMQTHRFGRKIKLPATVAIKYQIRMVIAQDIKKAELAAHKNKEKDRGAEK
jgi:hypothetical protein